MESNSIFHKSYENFLLLEFLIFFLLLLHNFFKNLNRGFEKFQRHKREYKALKNK